MLCFGASTNIEETATFSMLLTDWKVFFQITCFRSLPGKVGQLFSQHPWPTQQVQLRSLWIVSAAFGPSQTKLLCIGNGKLRWPGKPSWEQASSLPGNEFMQLCKKEATVCGWPVCGQSKGEHDPAVLSHFPKCQGDELWGLVWFFFFLSNQILPYQTCVPLRSEKESKLFLSPSKNTLFEIL